MLKYQEELLGRFAVIYGFRVLFDSAYVKRSCNGNQMQNSATVDAMHFDVIGYLPILCNRRVEIQLRLKMPEPLRFRIEPLLLCPFHN